MKATMAGMEWDVCEPRLGRPRSGAHVTINLINNTMFVAADAMDLAGKPSFVRILYSEELGSIALVPSRDTNDAIGLSVTHQLRARGVGGMVWIGDLAQRLRSRRLTGSFRVPMEWHPDGMLWGELDMRKATQRKAGQRKGPAKGGAV